MFRNAPLLLLATLIGLIGYAPANYPQDLPASATARKFDEFGDIVISDKKARMDNFVVQLQQEPEAKGYIIVYHSRRDRPGLSVRLLDQMRRYLLYNRGLTSDRIVTIDGGPATNLVQEFWIVPPGTTPEIRSDAYTTVVEDRTVARVYDEYFFDLDDRYLTDGDLMGDSIPGFAAALHREPESLAYVIAYPQCRREGRRNVCDPRGSAARMLKGIRLELTKTHNVPATRLRLVNGGYRRQRAVELWIVPRGEHPPIATPNAYPPRRQARRNTNHSVGSTVTAVIPAPAPIPQSIQDAPRKFDEFGDILITDLKSRWDNFLVELQREPMNVGYIVFYRSRRDGPGMTARQLSVARSYMVRVRGFDDDRLVTIDGGTAANLVQEFWIAPRGAEPPRRADAFPRTPDDFSVTTKFDDTYYNNPYDDDAQIGDSLPAFAKILKQNPMVGGHVIVYPHYYTEREEIRGYSVRSVSRDSASMIRSIMNDIRKRMTHEFGIPRARLRIINGGHRKVRSVELWLVPKGERPPVATPNAFPPRRRRK